MNTQTLFGSISLKLGVHPENLATEALNFVLGKSEIARRVLMDVAGIPAASHPNDLVFRTQVALKGSSIPDLVGFDGVGREALIVEAKFWAGLTDNQPVSYLKRLPVDLPGVLLFVAPERRFLTLSSELIRRCGLEGFHMTPVPGNLPERLGWQNSGIHRMVLVSWRLLLDQMSDALRGANEYRTANDVDQIKGLCAQMDSEAFLPLRSEELTFTSPQRILLTAHPVLD